MPFVLSALALLIALGIMSVWMLISYRQSKPLLPEGSANSSPPYEEVVTSGSNGVIVLDFEKSTRFFVIQLDAADGAIRILPIPQNLADENGNTLHLIYEQHGALQIAHTLSTVFELPIERYLVWDDEGALSFLNELSNGVIYQLPEDIQYTDKNGTSMHLKAGQHKLTGSQAAAILQHHTWKNPQAHLTTAAALMADVINQYMLPQQNLDAYFSAIADSSKTNLRIDNYNGARQLLTILAGSNTGNLCVYIECPGIESDGLFIPNTTKLMQSDLY